MKKPASTSLTEKAYQTLRADLLACRLQPGARLQIADLCQQFGFSLGAVREALAKLTVEGLVVSEVQRGFRAAPVSLDDLRDLTETRITIEAMALRSAIEEGDLDWETAIIAVFHRLSRIPEREAGDEERLSDEWAEAHRDFHSALVSACKSRYLLRLRDMLYAQSERYRRISVPKAGRPRDIGGEHREIMEATIARDVEKAVRLLSEHFRLTSELVEGFAEISAPTVDRRSRAFPKTAGKAEHRPAAPRFVEK